MLFTEEQWRAIATVEQFTADRPVWPSAVSEKRIHGPLFADGEYFVVTCTYWLHDGIFGPPTFAWHIYERLSDIRFTGAAGSPQLALSLARRRIVAIGTEYYAEMLAKAKIEQAAFVAEQQAESEAQAAIARARLIRKSKPKKIGRRRRAIFEESGGACHYCATAITIDGDWHIEHKMPKALGGGDVATNLVASCVPCNHAKLDRTDVEFFAMLAARKADHLTHPETQKAAA